MQAKAIKRFWDKTARVMREKDEEFRVTKERFEAFNSTREKILVTEVKSSDDSKNTESTEQNAYGSQELSEGQKEQLAGEVPVDNKAIEASPAKNKRVTKER